MTDEEILAEFRAADALLEGHFILSSGLRSPRYLQCARVLMDPARAERLARALAAKFPAELRERDRRRRLAGDGRGDHRPRNGPRAGQAGDVRRTAARDVSSFRRGFRLEPGPEGADGRGRGHHRPVVARGDHGDRGSRRQGDRRAASLVDRSGGSADLGVPFYPLIRIDVPTYDARRTCRPSWPRFRRSSRGAARPHDRPASASASISTMSRPSGTRAAATIPIRSARRMLAAGGRRRRHHRPSARGPAPHHRRGHRPADGRDRPAAEPGDGGDRGDAGDRASRIARTPPASSPRSARSGPPRAASTPPASTTTSRYYRRQACATPASASACSSSRGAAGRGRVPARRAGRRIPHRPLRPCRGRGPRRPS